MTCEYSKSTPSLPGKALQATDAIIWRGNFYILIDEHVSVSLEDIQLELTQDHWSENSDLMNCSTCVSGGAERRHWTHT